MKTSQNPWPVMKRYDQEHIERIALPLGGIGTGTVSLGGRGDLRDWEMVNRPAKGFTPRNSFFALWAKAAGSEAVIRCLEGPIPASRYEGSGFGANASNHGLPRFRKCTFSGAYPLGQVHLSDRDIPVDVRIEAFNPLIPGDAEASGIPVAVLRFVLTNKTNRKVEAAVCGNVENFIGRDGTTDKAKGNLNELRRAGGIIGVAMRSEGVAATAETWGTVALATTASKGVTCRTAWADVSWGDTLLDYWDDFAADGKVADRERGKVQTPVASVSVSVSLPPKSVRTVTFLLAWHFPNRMTWEPKAAAEGQGCNCADGKCIDPNHVGNFYTTQYADAWDAAVRTARDLGNLERKTISFVRAMAESSLPEVVKEAALFNVSALRSQTTFRTPDGRLFGWEGCSDKAGCCFGSCTHVWNYEQATAFLFGDLARTMRCVEFDYGTDERGKMSFRFDLPLSHTHSWGVAAADGQLGCLMKLYREWRLCGDDAFLRSLWPAAKRALEFAWIEYGWDGDRDGVMEGCQHNTMDVEYYGPNPQMQGWYLGALRAAEEMSRYLGETGFADRCRGLFVNGRRFMDEELFNGEYYEHLIQPISDVSRIAPGIRHESMGPQNLAQPELQLGAGCLVDQLVGQFAAHVMGLGYLHDPKHVTKTLKSIMRFNFKKELWEHFNHSRCYALQEESAMLMASYPLGRRPKRPFPYYTEAMTGFEYTAAVGMLYEGLEKEGLELIESIRSRYDGKKRNPFDEPECGHHYARAMASWGAVLALSGFEYSAVTGSMAFAPRAGDWFWSNGTAWGTCRIQKVRRTWEMTLSVLHGEVRLKRLGLRGAGEEQWKKEQVIREGKAIRVSGIPVH